ncbi:MAG TPA: serine hydrolase [Blastocatellia bacterium]|nr:serine hydrolase [Blastocatellia bacterium]
MNTKNKTGIRRAAALIALLLLIGTNATAQDLTPKFDEYMSALLKQGRFTGCVLVARDGKVVFSKGYGMANVELDVPNTPQTKFRLGSVTKQFTASAILLLQERGKLNVTDPICKYVENCPTAWSEVTIHHLLSHTGGIPNFTSLPDYVPKMMMPVAAQEMIARFKDKPLDFKPGEKWSYSNSGYFLLGFIIEKVAGESYESFLQKNIFEPLKMTATGYDHFETILKHRATGYSLAKGKPVNSAFIDMTQPFSAGSLYSTVEDLFLWNEALFGGKVLSAKSFEAMTTPVKNNYGYGLGIITDPKRKSISHAGGINGFATNLLRLPEERVTVVVLRNADYGTPAPGRISLDLAAILLGEKYEIPAAVSEIKVNPKIYDAYVGRYQLAPNFILEISKVGDRLMAQATGQPAFELFPESETKFFLKVIDAKVTFVKDDKGQVTHLILHQGGDREAKKIN